MKFSKVGTCKHRFLRLIFLFLVLLLATFYIINDFKLSEFSAAASRIPIYLFAYLIALSIFNHIMLGLRLKTVSPSLRLVAATKIEILASGANIMLPAKAGDLLKIGLIAKRTGTSLASATRLAMWVRFADLHLLAFIAAMVTPYGSWVFIAVVATGWLGLVVLWQRKNVFYRVVQKIPFTKVRSFSLDFVEVLQERPRFFLRLFYCTSLAWLVYFIQYYLAADIILSIPIELHRIAILFVVAAGVSAIPGLPAGVGAYEAGIVFLLESYGIVKEEAVLFSICMRATLYAPPMVAAIFLGAHEGISRKFLLNNEG